MKAKFPPPTRFGLIAMLAYPALILGYDAVLKFALRMPTISSDVWSLGLPARIAISGYLVLAALVLGAHFVWYFLAGGPPTPATAPEVRPTPGPTARPSLALMTPDEALEVVLAAAGTGHIGRQHAPTVHPDVTSLLRRENYPRSSPGSQPLGIYGHDPGPGNIQRVGDLTKPGGYTPTWPGRDARPSSPPDGRTSEPGKKQG